MVLWHMPQVSVTQKGQHQITQRPVHESCQGSIIAVIQMWVKALQSANTNRH